MAAGGSDLGDLNRPVKLVPNLDWSSLTLSAQEGFVLSRVDNATTANMICQLTGLGEHATRDLIRSLRDKGALTLGDEPPRKPAKPAPVAPRSPSVQTERIPTRKSSSTSAKVEAPSAKEASVKEPVLEPTAAERELFAREDLEGIDLKHETRLTVRRFYGELREKNFFELIGTTHEADVKELRRAYFKRSKQFHPDRFYTKSLGPYEEMLEEIFRQVNAAWDFLQNDGHRKAYVDTILVQQQNAATARAEAAAVAGATDEFVQAPATERVDGISFEERSSPSATYAVTERQRDVVKTRISAVDHERAGRPTGGHVARDTLRADELGSATMRAAGLEAAISAATQASSTPTSQSPAADPARAPRPTQEFLPDDDPDRAERRSVDRQRRRSLGLSHPALQRKQKGQRFYEQGLKQLEEGKSLAATASLKLALSFDPENPEILAAHERAFGESAHIAAENAFKRAMFEESVGRSDVAARYYRQAADCAPKRTYLFKAAELLKKSGELVDAKHYASEGVRLSPADIELRLLLAEIFIAAGLWLNARREVEAVLAIDKKHEAARELLKRIRRHA